MNETISERLRGREEATLVAHILNLSPDNGGRREGEREREGERKRAASASPARDHRQGIVWDVFIQREAFALSLSSDLTAREQHQQGNTHTHTRPLRASEAVVLSASRVAGRAEANGEMTRHTRRGQKCITNRKE